MASADSRPDARLAAARSRVRAATRTSRWVLAACAVLALILWLVTRSWFIVALLRPGIEDRLGGDVTLERAAYLGGGRFLLEGLSLRARDQAGEAGEILRVDRGLAAIELVWLLRGQVRMRELTLQDLLIRLSEDRRDPGVFSFMGLRPDWSGGGPPQPPEISLRNAAIERGEHEGDAYTPLGRLVLSGKMFPLRGGEGWFAFSLREQRVVRSTGDGMIIRGQWNAATNAVRGRVEGFEFARRVKVMCPSQVQAWWDRMDPRGGVRGASIGWDLDRSWSLQLDIDDMALTLPIEPEGFWTRYRAGSIEPAPGRPRMHVTAGTIRLANDRLELEDLIGVLRGADDDPSLAAVPYRVDLTIPRVPSVDLVDTGAWLERVAASTPFEMIVRLNEFDLAPDASGRMPAVDLPLVVARQLARFGLTDWQLTAEVRVRREASEEATATTDRAALQTSGHALIREARGAFERFPYQIEQIDAYIEFDHDSVTVHELGGVGSGGAPVRIRGTIRDPGREAEIALHLTAQHVPVDDRLRAALSPGQQALFDALLHEPSARHLAEAGLGPEAGTGGTVDLDLRIERKPGSGERTTVTGELIIQSASVVYDRFPYPLSIGRGTVRWLEDGIEIDGLPLSTPGGGRGSVAGAIRFERADGRVALRPDLRLEVTGDAVNENLLAAIPLTASERSEGAEGWPGVVRSRAARLLETLGLSGPLDHSGEIKARDDGGVGYCFDLRMRDGRADIRHTLLEELGAGDAEWPEPWSFTDVRGHLRVADGRTDLLELTGRRDECLATATAQVTTVDGRTETALRVDLADLPLDAQTIERLLPPGGLRWRELRPHGHLDATIDHRSAAGVAETSLTFAPDRMHLDLGGTALAVSTSGGAARLEAGELRFDELALSLERGGEPDGAIVLDGTLSIEPEDAPWALQGTWTGGRFDSPLLRWLVDRVGDEDLGTAWARYQPRGRFDAEFQIDAETRAGARYEMDLEPRTLSLDLDGVPVALQFDQGGHLLITPGRVEVQGLSARHADGHVQMTGDARLDERVHVDLTFDYDGRLMSRQVQAFLPQRVQQALREIALEDGEASRVSGLRLVLDRPAPSGEGPIHPDDWSFTLRGDIITNGAAFSAGTEFQDVAGRFRVAGQRERSQPPALSIEVADAALRCFGRPIEGVSARLRLDDAGRTLRLDEMRGDLYGGAISATATVELEAGAPYACRVDLAGVAVEPFFEREDGPPAGSDPGELFAAVTLSGRHGEPGARRGRGSIRVLDGRVANVPLALRIMQLMQLSLVLSDRLDFAEVEFYVAGDRLEFERLLLESTVGGNVPLQLLGEGWIHLPTWELRTRFRSRGGLLLLRDLVGGIGDQLYVIQVTGPLSDPRASVVPLPMLGGPEARVEPPRSKETAAAGDS